MLSPEEVEARFQRIEGILAKVAQRQEEMAARQQYHDEAFDRMDERLLKLDALMAKLTKTMDRLPNIE